MARGEEHEATMTRRVRSPVLLALALACSGCWQPDWLPPQAAPMNEMPRVRADLPTLPTGRQWVVLDTPGEMADVSTFGKAAPPVGRTDKTASSDTNDFLCSTPCALVLPSAAQDLRFKSVVNATRFGALRLRLDDALRADAKPEDVPIVKLPQNGDPLVVRYVLPELHRSRSHTVFYGLSVAGVFATLAGGFMAGGSIGNPQVQGPGFGVLGLGVALAAVSLPLAYVTRGTYTPGALTSWTVTREGATPPPAPPP
jgi:hypothetical protein